MPSTGRSRFFTIGCRELRSLHSKHQADTLADRVDHLRHIDLAGVPHPTFGALSTPFEAQRTTLLPYPH
jgi:hypothetical protein